MEVLAFIFGILTGGGITIAWQQSARDAKEKRELKAKVEDIERTLKDRGIDLPE